MDAEQSKNKQNGRPSNADGSLLLERTEIIAIPGTESDNMVGGNKPEKVRVDSKADLTTMYIGAAYPLLPLQFGPAFGQVQGAGIHVLPIYIDELEAMLGTDIYQKMLIDAQVKAADITWRASVLDKPVQVFSAVDEDQGDMPDQYAQVQATTPSPDAPGEAEKGGEAQKQGDQGKGKGGIFGGRTKALNGSAGSPASQGSGGKPTQSAKSDGSSPTTVPVNRTEGEQGSGLPTPPKPAPKPLTPEQKKAKIRATLAQNVADFVRANLEQLPGGMQRVNYEMLEGMALGYKYAEMLYEIKEIIPGNGPQTCLKAIECRPHEAASMVADRYNHLLGWIPRRADQGMFTEIIMGDLGTPVEGKPGQVSVPDMIPPEKVWCFTWGQRNGDRRGTSGLRGAYVPWRLKIGLYPAFEAYLARFAQPSVVLELGGQDLPPVVGSDGQLITDRAGIQAAILSALRAYQAGGALLLPVGTSHLMESTKEGEVYLKAFEHVNGEIVMSILLNNLTSQQSKYGTKGLGEVQQDTGGTITAVGKELFAASMLEDVVVPLVRYNYGEEGLKVLPRLSFGETEQQDFNTYTSGVAAMKAAGMVFPHQYNDIFESIHWKPLPEEVVTLLIEQWHAELAGSIAMAQNPMGMPAPAEDPNAAPEPAPMWG